MFIHFLCLWPLGLAIKLKFNTLKVAYWGTLSKDHTGNTMPTEAQIMTYLRMENLKTLPYLIAHTHVAHISECLPPPPTPPGMWYGKYNCSSIWSLVCLLGNELLHFHSTINYEVMFKRWQTHHRDVCFLFYLLRRLKSIADISYENVASILVLLDQVIALNLPLQFLRFHNSPKRLGFRQQFFKYANIIDIRCIHRLKLSSHSWPRLTSTVCAPWVNIENMWCEV